jgi:hypothetical protein
MVFQAEAIIVGVRLQFLVLLALGPEMVFVSELGVVVTGLIG